MPAGKRGGGGVVNQEQNGKQCRSWWAVSSGSTLFAKVSVLDFRAERVKVKRYTWKMMCHFAKENNFCRQKVASLVSEIFKIRANLNSFGAKFQMTFVICFFFYLKTNYRLERRLYVKLKDWTSNIEPSHLDLCCLRKLLLSPVAVKELKERTYFHTYMCNTKLNHLRIVRKHFAAAVVVVVVIVVIWSPFYHSIWSPVSVGRYCILLHTWWRHNSSTIATRELCPAFLS